ncbi:MAG: glutaredoxin [Robiginitomaculum sp.]|nr:MAG: glutaredoxin [Robiginitomaculum sp.]
MSVVIYGKKNCIYCSKAIDLAVLEHLDFEYLNIDDAQNKANLLEAFPNVKTVPQIWVDGFHVGGYHEFAATIETKTETIT